MDWLDWVEATHQRIVLFRLIDSDWTNQLKPCWFTTAWKSNDQGTRGIGKFSVLTCFCRKNKTSEGHYLQQMCVHVLCIFHKIARWAPDEAAIININIPRLGNKVIASPSSGLRWDVNVAHWPPLAQHKSSQIRCRTAPKCFEPSTTKDCLIRFVCSVFNGTL